MVVLTYLLGSDGDTGQVDYEEVARVVSEHWSGATILRCTGVWEGEAEESALIVILHPFAARLDAESFRNHLKTHFRQDEVLMIYLVLPDDSLSP
jgi:hypothetical protein